MDPREKLEYLYGLSRFGIKTSLINITALCDRLGNPQDSYTVIHIAGTNGKGSTAAMLQSIFMAAGYRCGLYTSPHLVHFGERIRIDDEKLTDEQAADLLDELKDDLVRAEATFFEAATAMAFLHFQSSRVDIAVVETGLGGSWDATNILKPSICVFTPISLDHTNRLGNELPGIAGDKAGIIKPGAVVVSSRQMPEAFRMLKDRAGQFGCRIVYSPEIFDMNEWKIRFDHSVMGLICDSHPELSGDYRIPLPGRHQGDNVLTALAASAELSGIGFNVSPLQAKQGIEKVRWGGRLQILSRRPLTYYDVAHNPAAARVVAEFFREVFPGRKLRILFGIVREKNIEGVLEELVDITGEMMITRLPTDKSAEPEEVVEITRRFNIPAAVVDDHYEAVNAFFNQSREDEVSLITGSHYLGEPVAKKYLTYLK